MPDFCHLHCHTQYSLLDGASDISLMMQKAAADGQTAIAMTDHGNMYGAFKFVREAKKNNIKPIVGCEFYLVADRHKRQFLKSQGEKDKRYHQLLLAKNTTGYKNLSKLCSAGFTEGLYGKYPRIDKELLLQYHEGLIATSCCIGAEIPQTILSGDIEKAEELLKWWIDLFGEDFYIELQRHRGMDKIDSFSLSQEEVNQVLIGFAKKYNVKTIVTNDAHYVNEEDAAPHDVLLCVNTASSVNDEKRFKFPSSDFYIKSKDEMNRLFKDVPEAVDNTMEIASKIDELELARDVLLPEFPIPPEFESQEDFLRHLTFEGAKKRYGLITSDIEERIHFELNVINTSGYPGYFLITQDFTTEARRMGVSVGPGRGSAAGSVVAYCLEITNIDPIKYDLLFERFLNPERVSLPDIDIDFDDEGRGKVIDYVIEKYGKNQVAQIITYGTMAARMSLRDVGRVMDIPLSSVDQVAKSFPTHLSATLKGVLAAGDIDKKLKDKMAEDDINKAYNFRALADKKDEIGQMIRTAKQLEGSVRNTGIHACGVVITPEDITNIIPVTVAKDSDLLVSQFDNSVAEDAGLLKMDFLGLKTLTIIRDAVIFVKENHGIEIVIDEVDLEDSLTYELFEQGDTIGIFQYESAGMQKHLKDLKPNKFEDLIAMNALYRPGPLQYIPNFINRKHGREAITYDLPDMEDNLKETYGITVYQEQVMLLSQRLADFTKGEADVLRKAMGKKNKKLIDQLWPKFLEGCTKNNHPEEVVAKIWKDWEAFASYAFNKSHSTCYAFLAFQSAYLKAHYPAEYLAAVLCHNKSDITKINFFLREGKRMGIDILGPDIQESKLNFSVNKRGQIRFGLSAIKGVGEGPVEEIMRVRAEGGDFADIEDLVKRLSLRTVNKKCFDSLAMSGAFDCFEELHRAQYFAPSGNYDTYIEHMLKFGNTYQAQQENQQATLFGDMSDMMLDVPKPPAQEKWTQFHALNNEKEVTGIYLSGHPLDGYHMELKYFISHSLINAQKTLGTTVKITGIVSEVQIGVSKRGNGYCRFTMQDYNGSMDFMLFDSQYENWKNLIQKGKVLYIEGGNQQRFGSDRINFKIQRIDLLEGMAKKLTKSITIALPLKEISADIVTRMNNIFEESEGTHTVKFKIVPDEGDAELKELDMVSASFKVNADYSMSLLLDELGLYYKLN